jgi:hypothetical protein
MSEEISGEVLDEKDVTTEPSSASEEIVDAGQPEVEPEKPQLSEKEKALIAARDDNARKLRMEQDRAARLEAELQSLRTVEEPEPEIDEDMPITFGELKRLEAKKQQAELKKREQAQQTELQKKVYTSAVKTRDQYKDSEFTYDWAYQYAMENFPQEDINAIYLMSNPAQYLYDLVMIKTGNKDKKVVKDTIDTIQKNLKSPGTLSKTGGANSTMDTIKQVDKMSGQDFIAEMDRIIASGK